MSTRIATSSNSAVILGSTPTTFSNQTPYCINSGDPIPCYIENGQLKFKPNLTYTTAGKVTQTKDFLPIDSTGYPDGNYRIVLPAEGNQPYLINNNVFINSKPNRCTYYLKGSPTVINGGISNLSSTDYARTHQRFNPGNSAWRMVFKMKTPSAFSSNYISLASTTVYKFIIGAGPSGKMNWGMGNTSDSWNYFKKWWEFIKYE